MDGQLYLLAVTVMLLFALAITLPVLRDIVTEGLDRHHEQKTKELASDTETNRTEPQRGETDGASTGVLCPNCGAANDDEYSVCQECAERL